VPRSGVIRGYVKIFVSLDSRILSQISNADNIAFYRFLMCALTSVLRQCSSITSGRQALNYLVREGEPGRNLDPWIEFPRKLQQMVTVMESWNNTRIGAKDIQNTDSRHLPFMDDTINLVITSPPYGDAIHYDKEEKLSFAFLDFNVSRFHNYNIGKKGQTISLQSLPRLKYTQVSPTADQALQNMVAAESAKGVNIARLYSVYFNDILQVWRELWRVTKRGAKVCWCVGNNTRENVYIDNVKIAEEFAKSLGFTHLKTSLVTGFELFKIDRESVVLVEKP